MSCLFHVHYNELKYTSKKGVVENLGKQASTLSVHKILSREIDSEAIITVVYDELAQ